MEKAYKPMNEVLVGLFKDIYDIEEKALIKGEFKNITNNDMHIIEAVGIGQKKNMSSIAKAMSVTMGTLTISMNSLVKKGYVLRERSETDRRVVLISLTEKGERAFRHHEEFHREMIDAIVKKLGPEKEAVLQEALEELLEFFKSYSGKSKEKA